MNHIVLMTSWPVPAAVRWPLPANSSSIHGANEKAFLLTQFDPEILFLQL